MYYIYTWKIRTHVHYLIILDVVLALGQTQPMWDLALDRGLLVNIKLYVLTFSLLCWKLF